MGGARSSRFGPIQEKPIDFVLWKPSDEVNGLEFTVGCREPGWHIDMLRQSSLKLYGFASFFDIHAGGADLIFPHHENEVAQSTCANPGSEFARYWMHNGLLMVNGKKMSKSLGNFITIKDLRDRGIDGGAIRLTLLSTHYRHPLDWTERRLEESMRTIERWTGLVADVPEGQGAVSPEIVDALSDDLNTPGRLRYFTGCRNGEASRLRPSARLLA